MIRGLAKIILATYNLVDVPTINIALRVVQRSVEEFTDILAKNPGLWLNVVNAKGKVLFQAKSVSSGDVTPYRDSDLTVETTTTFSDNLPVGDGDGKAEKFAALKKSLDARANPDTRTHHELDLTGIKEALEDPAYMVKWHCEKCKQPSECRKMYEEGVEHVICAVCALKAKLPWYKLEKLCT